MNLKKMCLIFVLSSVVVGCKTSMNRGDSELRSAEVGESVALSCPEIKDITPRKTQWVDVHEATVNGVRFEIDKKTSSNWADYKNYVFVAARRFSTEKDVFDQSGSFGVQCYYGLPGDNGNASPKMLMSNDSFTVRYKSCEGFDNKYLCVNTDINKCKTTCVKFEDRYQPQSHRGDIYKDCPYKPIINQLYGYCMSYGSIQNLSVECFKDPRFECIKNLATQDSLICGVKKSAFIKYCGECQSVYKAEVKAGIDASIKALNDCMIPKGMTLDLNQDENCTPDYPLSVCKAQLKWQ